MWAILIAVVTPVDDRHLVAPVELAGLTGIETERDAGGRRDFGFRLRPGGGVSPDGVAHTLIAEVAELLADPDPGQPLALRPPCVPGQQSVQFIPPGADLRLRPDRPIIAELRRAGTDRLPDRVPRNAKLPADLPDRLPILEIRPPDLRNRLHNQLPKRAPDCLGSIMTTNPRGAFLDACHPPAGSLFHACSQANLNECGSTGLSKRVPIRLKARPNRAPIGPQAPRKAANLANER